MYGSISNIDPHYLRRTFDDSDFSPGDGTIKKFFLKVIKSDNKWYVSIGFIFVNFLLIFGYKGKMRLILTLI